MGWTGACSGTGTCALTMDADKSVTALFDTAPTLTETPTAVFIGNAVTVSFANIPRPTPGDWLSLYQMNAPDTTRIDFEYVSCTKTKGVGKVSGFAVDDGSLHASRHQGALGCAAAPAPLPLGGGGQGLRATR